MPQSPQKQPLQRNLPAFARARILDEIRKRGYALPCHLVAVNGVLVTVAFDVQGADLPQVVIPIQGSQWQRVPYQVGDPGYTIALAVDGSQNAGLSNGLPTMALPANFSSLRWVPSGNANFPPIDDPNKHVIYGPNGFEFRDTAGDVSIVGDRASGTITFKAGGKTWTFSAAGFTWSNGLVAETHEHDEVQFGTDKTSGPVAP